MDTYCVWMYMFVCNVCVCVSLSLSLSLSIAFRPSLAQPVYVYRDKSKYYTIYLLLL